MTPPRIVVATFNPGKVREIVPLFEPLGLSLTSLADRGIEEPLEETGATYEENARAKAEHYARLCALPAVADDSGIEVDALRGRPGVLSARYGGEGLDDAGRCRRLLEEMAGVPAARRGARYVAVAAIALPGGEARTFRGVSEGRILEAGRGAGGFGYDPLFLVPSANCSSAELTAEAKNGISHRALAFSRLAERLRAGL